MRGACDGYEYGFVTASLAGSGPGQGLSVERLGVELAEFSGALASSLRAMDGGGWEALSHQLVREGDAVIVTVMIRRAERGVIEA